MEWERYALKVTVCEALFCQRYRKSGEEEAWGSFYRRYGMAAWEAGRGLGSLGSGRSNLRKQLQDGTGES